MRPMRAVLVTLAAAVVSPTPVASQSFTIETLPSAVIYRMDPSGRPVSIGTGTAKFKVEKDIPNTIRIEAEGFEPVIRTFERGGKYPKVVAVPLDNRLVRLSALPYDAQIMVNGAGVGRQNAEVVVKPGESVTVELRKPGFRTKSRVYSNQAGMDIPPVSDRLELDERVVVVSALPSGTNILANGTPVGETTADVVIPRDKCVTASASRPGWAVVEKIYCNKEQSPEPPMNDALVLKERMVAVNVTPVDASIMLNGREVGRGSFNASIPEGGCTEVIVRSESYVAGRKMYCNQQNMPVPPTEEHFQLTRDEAYDSSLKSDQANVNFTIEVGANRSADDAWKLISQIVLSSFDVLEITDKDTGYMRTSWEVRNFPHNTIRTRVIVKLGDTAPLKYVVKIASESSGAGGTSVKDDESFKEWDRLLNSYKDIINEMQARLR